MKKSLLMLAAVLAALQLSAAPVDLAVAQSKAKQFLQTRTRAGQTMAPTAINPSLVLAEKGKTHAEAVVYYIFNTSTNFIIVAGDDRAEEILAVGDRPLDVDRMPANMKAWLEGYKEQIDYLFSNPSLKVNRPYNVAKMRSASTVEPLLTSLWDQDAPYWNQCVIGGNQCYTGCPATSAAMVFHYWKYPVDETPVVPGYRSVVNTSWWGDGTPVTIPALPAVTFDWDNMLDTYGRYYTEDGVSHNTPYNEEQGDAVATLMRYVGQAERMEYGTASAGGSGVDADSVCNIANAFLFFGYDESTVRAVKKTSAYSGGTTLYNDADWAAMIQEELEQERPIVYCAISNEGGHAFNVDGYDAELNKYHVNYGWSGEGNGKFALNAFSDGAGVFNQYQQMVIGIQPPVQGPVVRPSTRALTLDAFTNENATATFVVKGKLLTEDIQLTLADENQVFAIDTSVVALDEIETGKTITVTFAPKQLGTYTATITLTSAEAEDKVVTITGNATLRKAIPQLLEATEVDTTSFQAQWIDETPEENVESYNLVINQQGFERVEEVAKADFTTLNFSGLQADPMSETELETYCTPAGWNGTVYPDKGGVRLGYSSSDYVRSLNTPELDFTMSGGKLTITFNAKTYGSGSAASLVIQTGDYSVTQKLKSKAATYTVVLDCDVFANQIVTFTSKDNRVFLSSATITTTDITNASAKAPVEDGDAITRTITGITGKMYNVTNLSPAGTYFYKVQANFIDGTQSRWSTSKQVTLLGDEVVVGDVNGDGIIDVSDVNVVINIMLGKDDAARYGGRADVNGDGKVDVSDVNTVINIMLGK